MKFFADRNTTVDNYTNRGANKVSRIITILIIIGYVVVNCMMQVNFFNGNNIFDKYQVAASASDAIGIAQKAYYAKTGFLLILLILQVIGGNFYRSFAWSLSGYGIMMLCFFGIKVPVILYVFGGLLSLLGYYYGNYFQKKSI